MALLFISLALWCVVLYSFRVAVFGNPLYLCLVHTSPDTLCRADQVANEGRDPADEPEARFLRQFSRLSLLGFLVFLLETGLLIYLLATRQLVWLTSLLLLKNIVLVALSAAYAVQTDHDSLFRNLLNVPRWLITLDRLSSLVSGVGLLVVFLDVNGLHLWK